MLTELRASLRPAITLLVLFTLILGLAYPLLITGIAQVAMPANANGSVIRDGDRVIGSELIAQSFTDPAYFHPRLSAAGDGYNASASAASNLAPGSKDLADRINASVKQYRDQGVTRPVPADLATASGSGLDPHITPEAALVQVGRVAQARGLGREQVIALVGEQTEEPLLGFLGERRVNVLMLNRQMDRLSSKQTP